MVASFCFILYTGFDKRGQKIMPADQKICAFTINDEMLFERHLIVRLLHLTF